MYRAVGLSILLLTSVLAGCIGTEDDGEEPTNLTSIPETTAPPERAQEGDLVGVVTDIAQQPVAGAEVFLLRNQTVGTTTAQDGTYTLEDVEAGEHLVRAEADGFLGATFLVKVKSGRTTLLDIVLDPKPTQEPFHESRELAGLIDCSWLVASADTPFEGPCVNVDPNRRTTFTLEAGVNPARILLELVWEPNTPLAESLEMDAQTIGTGVQDVSLGDIEGPSVLRMDIPGALLERYYKEGGKYRVNVSAAPSLGDEEGFAVGAAVEQEFTLIVTTFFVEPGPSDFSALESNG